jgi:predicted nucleic acid-binding protein
MLMLRRLGFKAAERWWSGLRSGTCRVESVGEADLAVAWTIGEAFADQRFSIVDRTSFAVMLRAGLSRAASLDDDFLVFRHGAKRERAFDVIR